MKRPFGLSRLHLFVILFIAGGLLFAFWGKIGLLWRSSAPPAPAVFRMPVPVFRVATLSLPIYRDYIGTTDAIRNVVLEAMATGYLDRQMVPDGSDVRKGALIYRIDPRNYKATLDQVQAQKERDEAALEYAKTNQRRNAQMIVHGDVSKDAYQLSTSSMHQANATYLYDKAAMEVARINLGYTLIQAPFSGRLGKSLVYTGTLIGSGTQINTLVQMDPLYVTFNPRDKDFPLLERSRRKGPVTVDVRVPGKDSPPYVGILTFMDNVVDRTTGTFVARATLANPKFRLIPGEFVDVSVRVGTHPKALAVPQISVGSNQTGKYVYVIGKGGLAEIRPVSLGITSREMIEVRSGLKEGDLVIVGNLQKIGPGSPVIALPDKKKG